MSNKVIFNVDELFISVGIDVVLTSPGCLSHSRTSSL